VNRLLPALCCVLSLLLGLSIGWRIGHSAISAEKRQLLEDYQHTKATFGMSESDMLQLQRSLPELRGNLEKTDGFAGAIALSVLEKLELGKLEQAKTNLRQTVSIYYRSHQADGNTNLLLHIDQYAATNAALSNAIHRRLE
jgi:hypothetical protein